MDNNVSHVIYPNQKMNEQLSKRVRYTTVRHATVVIGASMSIAIVSCLMYGADEYSQFIEDKDNEMQDS